MGYSQPEEDLYKLLVKKYGKKAVVRQYRSYYYPFNCDFYIVPFNMYIEYQGTWLHGKRPFNPLNPIHLKQVYEWKKKKQGYFDNAIKVWTKLDPLKRKTAKKNHLKYVELWNFNEAVEFISKLPNVRKR